MTKNVCVLLLFYYYCPWMRYLKRANLVVSKLKNCQVSTVAKTTHSKKNIVECHCDFEWTLKDSFNFKV